VIHLMLDTRTAILQDTLDSRIKALPNLLPKIKDGMKKVWKHDDDYTFLYGWCIGRLEYILYNELKRFTGEAVKEEDYFIIRDLLELRRQKITEIIEEALKN